MAELYCLQCGSQMTLIIRSQGGGLQSKLCEKCQAPISERKRKHKDQINGRRKTLRKHGLDHSGYLVLLMIQNGGCIGCGAKVADSTGSPLHIDHDHAHDYAHPDGVVSCYRCFRFLVCGKCNRAIGLCDDNPQTLRNLADAVEAARIRSYLKPGFRYLETTGDAA